MVELLVSDEIFRPEVTRTPRGVRLQIPAHISYKEIEREVGMLLTPFQLMEVFDLWCNDATPREFERTSDGYLIRRSPEATSDSGSTISAYGRQRPAQ